MENVTASGRVGLLIREDSFTVENYDIEYRPENVSVTVLRTFFQVISNFIIFILGYLL